MHFHSPITRNQANGFYRYVGKAASLPEKDALGTSRISNNDIIATNCTPINKVHESSK